MKICYVTHLPNLTGANQSMLDLLRNMDRNEVEPIVLLGKHGPLEEELKKINVKYKVIRYTNEIKKGHSKIHSLMKRMINVIALYKICAFLKKEHIEVVHNNSFLVGIGMGAAQKMNIPYICHLRDFIWEDHKLILENPRNQIQYLENATLAIAVSNAVKNKYVKQIAKDNIRVLYDGIDCNKYMIDVKERKEVLDTEDKISLVIVGRISRGKGQLEAIKAVEELQNRKLNNIELYIVGSPGETDYDCELKEYVKMNRLANIYFIPHTPNVSKIREKCDIGLVCSVSEALGRVTVENMLAGCLTIGGMAGATTELIDNEKNGLLYEIGNYKDLADKIQYAIEHKNISKKMVNNAKEYALVTFDIKKYQEAMYNIYHDIRN